MPPPKVRTNIVVPSIANPVRIEVEKKIRQRLRLGPTAPIPADIKLALDRKAQEAASISFEQAITRDAKVAILKGNQNGLLQGFKDNVAVARQGIDVIAQSAEVDAILKRRAELLFKKREALVAAGFSNDEAMRIVLADLGAEG